MRPASRWDRTADAKPGTMRAEQGILASNVHASDLVASHFSKSLNMAGSRFNSYPPGTTGRNEEFGDMPEQIRIDQRAVHA